MAKSALPGLFLFYAAIANSASDGVSGVIAPLSTINLPVLDSVTPALALLRKATAGENRQRDVQSEILLRTGSSWDGEPYKSYPSGQPELTILKITLAPHTKLDGTVIQYQTLRTSSPENSHLRERKMEGSSVLPLDRHSRRQLTHSIEESQEMNPSYSLCSTLEIQAHHSLSNCSVESVPMMLMSGPASSLQPQTLRA